MSLRTWIASLGLAALAACGTVKGDDAMGDDMPDVDTTAPQLMTATPSDASTKASLLAPLTFVFDEELDAATVNEQSIRVTYLYLDYQTPVKGTVAYDAATKTVSFTPALPLTPNVRYTVRVTETLKDIAGNAFAGDDITFRTVTNQAVKSTSYNTSTNAVQSWQAYALDSKGHWTRIVSFDNPGPDLVWFNGDDRAAYHYEQVYDDNGVLTEYRGFDAGPDAIWNTGDDQLTYFEKHKIDAEGRHTEYYYTEAPGPDAMWGTADDPIGGYQKYIYSPGKVRYMYVSGAGNDGMWRTPDDRVTSYQEYGYDTRGFRTRYTLFNAGADQLPDTSDDTISSYYDYDYHVNGTQTSYRRYSNAGTDAMWMTADDVTSQIYKWATDSKGYVTSLTRYSNPGPDMAWNTADDVPSSYESFTNSPQGLQTSRTIYSGPGADTMWGNADDVVAYYYTHTYDQNGQKTDSKYYATPGADNVWKTGDDRVGNDQDYDIAH